MTETTNAVRTGMRILVVDDDRDTAETMACLLGLAGHRVRVAHDGYKAVEEARRHRPGCVLLDLGLPGLDGYKVASRLRHELSGPLVLVAVTGYGHDEVRRRALSSGFDRFFVKPIEPEALDELIAGLSARTDVGSWTADAGSPDPPLDGHDGTARLPQSEVTITNPLGLHLRAAHHFVVTALRFEADVWVTCDGRRVSGQSILELTLLGAACGSSLRIEADGTEAEEALEALAALVARGFGETGD